MIISCGEALVDLVPHAVPGGGPMNAAVASRRLGAPTAFVGRISTDVFGQSIWKFLTDNDVDTRACERGDEPTARAIVEHVPHLVFRFEGEGTADTMLERVAIERLDPDRPGSEPHVVHGGTLGMFRGRTAEVLARFVETTPAVVSLDPNVRPAIITDRGQWEHYHQRWLRQAHIYRGSEEDIDWIWPGRRAADIAAELLGGGLKAVFITRGAAGVTVHLQDAEFVVPPSVVEVVDTVGAGDTFVGGLLSGIWHAGVLTEATGSAPGDVLDALTVDDWRALTVRASAAAAITCSRVGANPPTADELQAFLAR